MARILLLFFWIACSSRLLGADATNGFGCGAIAIRHIFPEVQNAAYELYPDLMDPVPSYLMDLHALVDRVLKREGKDWEVLSSRDFVMLERVASAEKPSFLESIALRTPFPNSQLKIRLLSERLRSHGELFQRFAENRIEMVSRNHRESFFCSDRCAPFDPSRHQMSSMPSVENKKQWIEFSASGSMSAFPFLRDQTVVVKIRAPSGFFWFRGILKGSFGSRLGSVVMSHPDTNEAVVIWDSIALYLEKSQEVQKSDSFLKSFSTFEPVLAGRDLPRISENSEASYAYFIEIPGFSKVVKGQLRSFAPGQEGVIEGQDGFFYRFPVSALRAFTKRSIEAGAK